MARAILLVIAAGIASPAAAAPVAPARLIAAIAPGSDNDARKAVVIGAAGEVYEPDGKGAWVHKLPCSLADAVVAAGRASGTVIALGDGVVYRLAANGWSAIRLVQHGKAVLGAGPRPVAAVGRQIFALDPLLRGEPTKLAMAPANIIAIAAGAKAIVLATEAGVYRIDLAGSSRAAVALPTAPRRLRLVSDRWAIVDRGALDLTASTLTGWPSGLAIGAAAVTPDDALAVIGAGRAGLELVTLRQGVLTRDPLGLYGTAVGVVVDRAGRAVVALSDGRIAVRDSKGATPGWTTTEVIDEPNPPHPGAAPAASE